MYIAVQSLPEAGTPHGTISCTGPFGQYTLEESLEFITTWFMVYHVNKSQMSKTYMSRIHIYAIDLQIQKVRPCVAQLCIEHLTYMFRLKWRQTLDVDLLTIILMVTWSVVLTRCTDGICVYIYRWLDISPMHFMQMLNL